MFPTFPSKAGQERRRKRASPRAPERGDAPRLGGGGAGGSKEVVDFSGIFAGREEGGAGFSLKLV